MQIMTCILTIAHVQATRTQPQTILGFELLKCMLDGTSFLAYPLEAVTSAVAVLFGEVKNTILIWLDPPNPMTHSLLVIGWSMHGQTLKISPAHRTASNAQLRSIASPPL